MDIEVRIRKDPWFNPLSVEAFGKRDRFKFMRRSNSCIICSLLAGLLGVGCASPREKEAFRELQRHEATPIHSIGNEVPPSGNQLPELNEESGLKDYLLYAALNNPGLEAAFNQWKAELERVPQARALEDPRFNYSYYIQRIVTAVGTWQEQTVGISQMFPWFGELRLRGEAALAGADAAQQQYYAAQLALFNEVIQSYYELFYLGRVIDITRQNVELLQRLEQIANAKYAAGTAEHGDVIKAQLELDKLRDRLLTLEDLRQPRAARLNAALNRPAEAPLPLPKKVSSRTPSSESARLLEQMPENRTDVTALIDRLQTKNPDLKSLNFQAEQEQKNIALARKQFYPDVTLGVSYIKAGLPRTPGVADSGEDPIVAGVSLNIPLWWGKYRAAVQEAESRYNAKRNERLDRSNRLTTDLKLAVFKYQDAERKIDLYREGLIPKAEDHLKVAQRAYQAGKTDFLSLLDAERILLELQLTYERAVANREQALATVEKLVGEEPAPIASEAGTKQ